MRSEGDVVAAVIGRGRRRVVAATGTGGRTALLATLGFSADESEVFQNDAEARTLLAGLLVFPLVEFEASFDEDARAFTAILGDNFRLLAVALDVDVGDFLALFAFLGGVGAIDGERELREGLARASGSRVMLPARMTRL